MLDSALAERLFACPSCRSIRNGQYHESPLQLAEAFTEEAGHILHGFLDCASCPARFPIIDGIPILVREPGEYLKRMEDAALWRDDLPPPLRLWLLAHYDEQTEPGCRRQLIAVYGRTLQPPAVSSNPFQRQLNEQLMKSRRFLDERQTSILSQIDAPLVLDMGCGVGTASLAAAREGARVISLDSDFAALRVLSKLIRYGRVELPSWRHGGNDYQLTEAFVPPPDNGWPLLPVAADALNPPLRGDCFDLVTCYNLVDNVSQPVVLLRQIHAILKVGGRLLLTSPYDWCARCTPPGEQLGSGVSQDGELDPAVVLRNLLAGGLPEVAPEVRFRIVDEVDPLPWLIQRHTRSYHVFLCQFLDAAKAPLTS